MDHQKSANQQHSSHNVLCALAKFLYLSGPPQGNKPQSVVSLPHASGSTEESKVGPHKDLWPLPPLAHQPKAACYWFSYQESKRVFL